MSKVITFSRHFQKSHPRVGEPTYFVEKIWHGLRCMGICSVNINNVDKLNQHLVKSCSADDLGGPLNTFKSEIIDYHELPKCHTIRSGHRFKVGDKFSPRVWSGKPYASKQIIIAPDIEVKKVFDIIINQNFTMYINGSVFRNYLELSKNDGLEWIDFYNWFDVSKEPFDGQIICWSYGVEY